MIAIVDGGSTKCDWVILENSGKISQKTESVGFNPNIINADLIPQEIEKNPHLFLIKNQLDYIYFYGSGCGTVENALLVETQLQKVFPYAKVTVKEDLTAAAYAAYNGKPAIVCILGTGSNSCYFDGESIRRDLPSLGFLIGDEGSGSALGKHLVRRFFMKKLPQDLHQEFVETYHLTIEDAITFFEAYPVLLNKLKTLDSVGLGYITLGQSSTHLSGGEAQRIKLATELSKRSTGNTLYILDEPSTGLHFEDIHKLISLLQLLVDQGNSVLIIEHNLEIIKTADWIVDLGPGGGDGANAEDCPLLRTPCQNRTVPGAVWRRHAENRPYAWVTPSRPPTARKLRFFPSAFREMPPGLP